MTKSEQTQRTETPLDRVAGKIRAAYKAPVAEVMQCMQDQSLCVVAGPFGIGKSTYLIPMLQQRYESQGVSVSVLDNQAAPNNNYLVRAINGLPTLAESQRGILILDEAGTVAEIDGVAGTKAALAAALSKGYDVVAVIAHPANSDDARERTTHAWKEAAETSSVVNLPLYRLKPSLAKEFLMAVVDNFQGSLPEEVVKFIIDTVPGSMNLLYILGQMTSEQQTIEDARSYIAGYPDRLRSLFTQREYDQLWRKLYPPLPRRRKRE